MLRLGPIAVAWLMLGAPVYGQNKVTKEWRDGFDRGAQARFIAAGQKTLEKAGRTAEAKKMLETGNAAAQRTGNKHALSEMSAMVEELER